MIYLYESVNKIPTFDFYDMPEERILKMVNYKKKEDKIMCYATFQLLKYALNLEYGIEISKKTKFGYKIRGKPYLLQYPKIHFNISHCYPVALCFVADGEVGADVQTIVKKDDLEIIKLIGSPSEIRKLENAPNPQCYFTRLWTLKESYLKYLGKGLDDALSRYDFGQVNTNRFSAFKTDFFSKQIGKYYISVCKRKLQSKDIQIIKM